MGIENGNSGGGNTTYMKFVKGKIAQSVKQDYEGATPRVNKLGDTVYEIYHRAIVGQLIKLETKDSPYGVEWGATIDADVDGMVVLQFAYQSRYDFSIMQCLPNMDVSKRYRFQPVVTVKGGKEKINLYITEEGKNKSVEWFYALDGSNGLPPMEKKTTTKAGKTTESFDSSARQEFLFAKTQELLAKLFPGNAAPKTVLQEKLDGNSTEAGEGNDSLPF